MKKRIGWVDTMKCICILFVMLAHLESGSPVLDAVYTPVFLTGFLFAAGYTYVPEDDFPEFMRKKGKTLLWPWLFFSTFNLLSAQVFSLHRHDSLWTELKWNLLQIRGEGDGLWFVAALFVAFVPFYWFIRWYESSRAGRKTELLLGITLGLSALSVFYSRKMDPELLPWNSSALPWHLEYAFQAGFFMTLGYLARVKNWQDRGWWSVGIYAGVLLAGEAVPLWLWYPWQYLEQTTGVFALMGVSRKLPRHPVTEQLGRSTLLCFALHGKVMSILEWMLRRAVPGGYAQVLENPWLSPLLAMMLTVLMALILLVPIGIINRWCPFLLGRKRRR